MSPSESKRGVAVLSDDDAGSGSHLPATASSKRRRTSTVTNAAATAALAVDEGTTTQNPSTRRNRSSRRSAVDRTPASGFTRVVTPSQAAGVLVHVVGASTASTADDDNGARPVRRALLQSPGKASAKQDEKDPPKAKRRLAFGRVILETPCQKNVQDIYKIISKLTGSVGGNGSFGAIYGELTVGSMQKIIDLMKSYTDFSSASRFIDVGAGLGKPSLHVCQDPGVEFSYGIEMEMSRWMLGMANLQAIIKAAKAQEATSQVLAETDKIGSHCFFDHGNIMDAMSFDPFTHVYMFSIG